MFSRIKSVITAFVAPWLIVAVLGLFHLAPALAAPVEQTGTGPTTWTAYMGHEAFTQGATADNPNWEMDAFYPSTLTIHAGDTVVWKHNSMDNVHTVTFLGPEKALPDFNIPPQGNPPQSALNPNVFLKMGGNTFDPSQYMNSGVMASNIPGPHEYQLTFSTPGTYTYYCAIHAVNLPDGQIADMQGQIVVLPADAALPMTPAQVEAQARAEMAADDQAAMQADAQANHQTAATSSGPNGNTVYHVNVGYQMRQQIKDIDYMRFAPSEINIKVGDTVEWTVPTDHGFHNILLGSDDVPIFNVVPQQVGPPKAYLNNEVFGPVGPNSGTYNGTGVTSAGIIVGKADVGPGAPFVSSYTLTFTKPGRYEYICALHDEMGMKAYVNVSAAGGTSNLPGMPTTGGGTNWANWMLLVLVVSLGLVALGGGVLLRFGSADIKKQ